MGTYLDFVVLSEEEKLKLSNGDLVNVSSDEMAKMWILGHEQMCTRDCMEWR